MPRQNAKDWTEEEDAWLKENYATCTREEAEEEMGRTWKAVSGHANVMGIFRQKKKADTRKLGRLNAITVKNMAKILGIQEEEIELWAKVYPECFKVSIFNKNRCVNYDLVVKFLKNHQDLWDSTKMPYKDYFDEYRWFAKKHDADFQRMIQARWGKDAK